MNKEYIKEFFDDCAATWDAEMIRNEAVIKDILDDAQIEAGVHVLDVACGTGVLFPDYIKRNVASITGVDISPKMVEITREKFQGENIKVTCADVEELNDVELYDRIMVYNAFPHFPDAKRLIFKLVTMLKPGGILTIAHGMSRERINQHHAGRASNVSEPLMEVDELSNLFDETCKLLVKVSSKERYQVSVQNLNE